MSITKTEIERFAPNAAPAIVAAIVRNWPLAEAANINTPRRIRHFFAQLATETGGLHAVEESLSYSSVERIREVWPTRFKSDAAAAPFVRNPKALAIKVYGGRLGNAPAPSTDGWDYRGGGGLQTTGRENYAKLGFEDNPEALRDPDVAFETAVREWENRGCNELADADNLEAVRRKINGGLNGIADARSWLAKAKQVWPDGARPAAPAVPAKPAASGASAALIKQVQAALIAKGYPEVGLADGKFGSKTRGAILAFEADHGMPLTGLASAELWEAINDAEAREVAPARAEGKPKGNPVLQSSAANISLASVLGGGSLLGFADPIVKNLEGGAGLVARVKGALMRLLAISVLPRVSQFALQTLRAHWSMVAKYLSLFTQNIRDEEKAKRKPSQTRFKPLPSTKSLSRVSIAGGSFITGPTPWHMIPKIRRPSWCRTSVAPLAFATMR